MTDKPITTLDEAAENFSKSKDWADKAMAKVGFKYGAEWQSQQKETKPTGFPNAIESNDRLNEVALKVNPTVVNGKSEFHLAWRLCYDWLKESQRPAPLPKPVEDKADFAKIKNEVGSILFDKLYMSSDGNGIEANPAAHTIAEYIFNYFERKDQTPKPVSEEGAEEIIKSFIRSCVEGYQDAKINGKKVENFHGLVNMIQFKEWCNYIFQDNPGWRLTHFQPEPKPPITNK